MNQGNFPRSWINFHHKENEMEDKKSKTISKEEEGGDPEETSKKLNWGNGRRTKTEKNKMGGWIDNTEEKEKLGRQKQVWLNKKEEEVLKIDIELKKQRQGDAERGLSEEAERSQSTRQRFRSAQVNQILPIRPTFLLPFNWLIYHVPRLQIQHWYLWLWETILWGLICTAAVDRNYLCTMSRLQRQDKHRIIAGK